MNILIIRFSSLGDLVTLEPTFRAIKYFYKNSHITFLTSSVGKGLYEDSGYFDEFIVEKTLLKKIISAKKKEYDIIFNLQCNRPSHIITHLVKRKLLIDKSYTMMQKFLKLKANEYDIKAMLVKSGIQKDKIDRYIKENPLQIKLPFKKDPHIEKTLKEKFGNKKLIAIAPGASPRWISKKWGKENYAKLVGLLRKEYGIVLIGSSLEKEDADFISLNYGKDILNMVNKTNLSTLKSLISYLDLFIGNDSGPTHIAAAIGVSTVTIFGATSLIHCPKNIYKDNEHYCIKPSENIKCHPCYKSKCPTNLECMKDIKPEQIYKIVQGFFNEAS